MLFQLAVLFAVAFAVDVSDNEQVLSHFSSWMRQHNKVYVNEEETALRLRNFKASLDRIASLNERTKLRGEGATYGLNKFSDMSSEEFRSTVLMKPFTPTSSQIKADNLMALHEIIAPNTFDWRTKAAVTAVKDQAQCGSCWAFSVTENVESVWILAKGLTNSTIPPLSPQQIVDCDTTDEGCNGGNPETAYAYIIGAGGLDTDASYPYTATDGSCAFKSSDVAAKIASWSYATNSGDETTLQNNLVAWAPLSICVDARYWQDYQSGVLTAYECDWVVELDHCVQLVGYDTTASTPYWNVRNSWSTGWGEEGYIRLQMGSNTCGLTEEATSAKV